MGRSLFKILCGYKYLGAGVRVQQNAGKLKNPDSEFYVITRVRLGGDHLHGRCWGRLVKNGVVEKEDKIYQPYRHEWRLLSLPDYTQFNNTPECFAKIFSQYITPEEAKAKRKAATSSVPKTSQPVETTDATKVSNATM